MVDELLNAYSRIRDLEAQISIVNYRLDKITDILDRHLNLSPVDAEEGIIEELPIEMQDDGR